MREQEFRRLAIVAAFIALLTGCSSAWESPFMEGSRAPVVSSDTETSPGTPATYTVERGDSLWRVSKKLYGSGKHWKKIVEANPGLDPGKLQIGQRLILPSSLQ